MIAPNLKYIDQINEQQKLIDFIKMKYKEKTGFDPNLQGLEENKSLIHAKSTSHVIKNSIIFKPNFTSTNFDHKP